MEKCFYMERRQDTESLIPMDLARLIRQREEGPVRYSKTDEKKKSAEKMEKAQEKHDADQGQEASNNERKKKKGI